MTAVGDGDELDEDGDAWNGQQQVVSQLARDGHKRQQPLETRNKSVWRERQ